MLHGACQQAKTVSSYREFVQPPAHLREAAQILGVHMWQKVIQEFVGECENKRAAALASQIHDASLLLDGSESLVASEENPAIAQHFHTSPHHSDAHKNGLTDEAGCGHSSWTRILFSPE